MDAASLHAQVSELQQQLSQCRAQSLAREETLAAWQSQAVSVAAMVQAVRDAFEAQRPKQAGRSVQVGVEGGSSPKSQASSTGTPAAFAGSRAEGALVVPVDDADVKVDTSEPSCLEDVCSALVEVKVHIAEMAFTAEEAKSGLRRREEAAKEAAAAAVAEAESLTTQLMNAQSRITELNSALAAARIEAQALEGDVSKAKVELLRVKRRSAAVSKYNTWGSLPRSAGESVPLDMTFDQWSAGGEGSTPSPSATATSSGMDTAAPPAEEEDGAGASPSHDSSRRRSVRFSMAAVPPPETDCGTPLSRGGSTPPSEARAPRLSVQGSGGRSHSLSAIKAKGRISVSSGSSTPTPRQSTVSATPPAPQQARTPSAPPRSAAATPGSAPSAATGSGERGPLPGRRRGGHHRAGYSTLPKGFSLAGVGPEDFLPEGAAAEAATPFEQPEEGGAQHGEGEAVAAIMTKVPLFSSLDHREQQVLLGRMESMRFGNQDIVFNGQEGGGEAWRKWLAMHAHGREVDVTGDMSDALFLVTVGAVTVYAAISSATGPFDMAARAPEQSLDSAADTAAGSAQVSAGGKPLRPGVVRYAAGSCFSGADVGGGVAVALGDTVCLALRPGVLPQVLQWLDSARHVAEINALNKSADPLQVARLAHVAEEVVAAGDSGRAYLAALRRHADAVQDLALPNLSQDLYAKSSDFAAVFQPGADFEKGDINPEPTIPAPRPTAPLVSQWTVLGAEICEAASQAVRDLQREAAVYLNGIRFDLGSASAVLRLAVGIAIEAERSLPTLLAAVVANPHTTPACAIHTITRDVLLACSRTHSGGDSFAQCCTVFGSPGRVIITPEPGSAPPINVNIADDTVEISTLNIYRVTNVELAGVQPLSATERPRGATSANLGDDFPGTPHSRATSRASFDDVGLLAAATTLAAEDGSAEGLALAVLRSEVAETLQYAPLADPDAIVAELAPGEAAAAAAPPQDTRSSIAPNLFARLSSAFGGKRGNSLTRRRSLRQLPVGETTAKTPPSLLCPAVLSVRSERRLSVTVHVLAGAS